MTTSTTSSPTCRRSSRPARLALFAAIAVLPVVALAQATQSVDAPAILKPSKDSWPTYHGDYTGRRNSPLTQITPDNVRNLGLDWVFQTGRNDQIKASPILGVGVGLRKQYDATNVVMSTLAETGVLGLVAFAAIFGTLFWMAWKAQRKVGRDDPNFSLMAAGTAVVFGKLLHGCVDHYWSRGIVPVWAGAGLVVFAYNYARRLPAQGTVTRGAA